MKTKPKPVPLNYDSPLFVKFRYAERSVLRSLSLGEISRSEEKHYQFLTWNGENFCWKELTERNVGSSDTLSVIELEVVSRTGLSKAKVHPDAFLLGLTAVYGLTKEFPGGDFRPASLCASGRSLASVSGPSLLPPMGEDSAPWAGKPLNLASTRVVKSKSKHGYFHPCFPRFEDATNVVMASGLIHHLDFPVK